MSTRGFWDGLDPETVRQQKISYYSGIKKERDSAYKLLEKFAEFEGVVRVSKKKLEDMSKTDFYDEELLDMNLIDRISYDEIGDYIDRGLLP